jgi:hypothetical protein
MKKQTNVKNEIKMICGVGDLVATNFLSENPPGLFKKQGKYSVTKLTIFV